MAMMRNVIDMYQAGATHLDYNMGASKVQAKKMSSDTMSSNSDDAPTRVTSEATIPTNSSNFSEQQWEAESAFIPEQTTAPPAPKKRIGKLLQKTTLCKHFMRGNCRFEEKCSFAHQLEDLLVKPNLEKTRMCAHFKAGYCRKYNCSYAHGPQELTTRLAAQQKLQAAAMSAAGLKDVVTKDAAPSYIAPSFPGIGQEPLKVQASFNMLEEGALQEREQAEVKTEIGKTPGLQTKTKPKRSKQPPLQRGIWPGTDFHRDVLLSANQRDVLVRNWLLGAQLADPSFLGLEDPLQMENFLNYFNNGMAESL